MSPAAALGRPGAAGGTGGGAVVVVVGGGSITGGGDGGDGGRPRAPWAWPWLRWTAPLARGVYCRNLEVVLVPAAKPVAVKLVPVRGVAPLTGVAGIWPGRVPSYRL